MKPLINKTSNAARVDPRQTIIRQIAHPEARERLKPLLLAAQRLFHAEEVVSSALELADEFHKLGAPYPQYLNDVRGSEFQFLDRVLNQFHASLTKRIFTLDSLDVDEILDKPLFYWYLPEAAQKRWDETFSCVTDKDLADRARRAAIRSSCYDLLRPAIMQELAHIRSTNSFAQDVCPVLWSSQRAGVSGLAPLEIAVRMLLAISDVGAI